MKIIPRDGIELVKVCDVYLLTPTRRASSYCRDIATLGFVDLLVWKGICKGRTLEEIQAQLAAFSFKKPEEMHERVMEIVRKYEARGFLQVEDAE